MREEFIALLTRLVLEGFISMAEARLLMDEFDKIDYLPFGWVLPLPLSEAMPDDLADRLAKSLDYFESFSFGVLPDKVQDDYIAKALELSRKLGSGEIDLRTWQDSMIRQLIDMYARMAAAASNGKVDAAEEEELVSILFFQLAFLSRFADQAASGRLSNAQIEERSKLYAGEGRAVYYEFAGRQNRGQYGVVEDYVAVDDSNTCGPCSEAENNGPYLPGQGPMPGRVCLGRGYCRCTRTMRYDPQAYLRLT